MTELETLDELESSKRRLLSAGGNLSHKRVQSELAKADARALNEVSRVNAPKYKWVSDLVGKLISGIALTFFTLVMVLGLFIALLAIPAAEYAAVYEGLYSIKPDENIAALTTLALFLGLLVLMFLRHVWEGNLDGVQPPTTLRYGAAKLLRWFGLERINFLNRIFRLDTLHARTRNETNYLRISSTLFTVEAVIVLSSALARLSTLLTSYGSNPAGEALELIRSRITATEVITTCVTIALVIGLIRMLDLFVLFIYVSFVNSAGALSLGKVQALDSEALYIELRERYQAEALNDLSLTLEHQNRNKPETLQG